MRRAAVLVATVGGCGYFPFAPGTVGSAAGIVIYLLTRHWSPLWQVSLLLIVSAVGVWASSETAKHLGREDPGPVVIDEVAGQLLTLFLVAPNWLGIVGAFFLFRVLDIIKPWPAGRFEQLPGGVGIMADDLMAGLYGNLLLRGVGVLLPWVIYS